MKAALESWQFWAIGSAIFAALTAIFAKIGVAGINPDFATFIRTLIVIAVLALIVSVTAQWQAPSAITSRTWIFLALSGLGTGASWLCYFRALKIGDAARVAPLDKMSILLVAVFGVAFLGERLSLLNWLGVAMCAGGIALLALR
ncbi:EamA family transporter [soil metagenome]